jgi:histidinol-phosphate aminotransferase
MKKAAKGLNLTPLAASLPATVPFVGPEAQQRARGRPFRARIGANESVFGPSPKAIAAMETAARDVWMYGDSQSHDLRHALAAHHGVPVESVMVGEGIDGLLGNLCRLFVDADRTVVTSEGAYPTFNYHVAGFGGRLAKAPYRDDREDPEALAEAAAREGAALVYFANPDNPMGTWHDAATVQRLIEAMPEGCLLCLDEAYVEFAPEGVAPPLDVSDPRVIRMRTFSKAYGMAGARIAYALGAPELIAAFDRVRNHFGVNRVAQDGALAALRDADWLAHVQREVAAARERIARIAADNGLHALPSAANFVAVDCGGDGDFARRVLAELIARDVFVRMPGAPPQDRCIRISAGTPPDLDALTEALPQALAAARSAS